MSGDDSSVRSPPDAGELTTGGEFEDVAPPPDDLFGALADATRRRVAWYLLEESPASVHELADVLAGWRLDEEAAVDPGERDSIVVALHHTHLPVLDDAGLVDYHHEDGTVEAASLTPAVEEVVRVTRAYDAVAADAEQP